VWNNVSAGDFAVSLTTRQLTYSCLREKIFWANKLV